jgi:hypothetical protein
MSTTKTLSTATPSISSPPMPSPPPDVVRARMDIPGLDYRALRRISLETNTSVNGMLVEAVRLLVRWYAAQGVPGTGDGQ